MSRTRVRAVTHQDLVPNPKTTDLSSKTGIFIAVLTIIFGLSCFVLCLYAEATRSQATWGSKTCVYNGSGKTPLLCGAIAFVGLAVAMVGFHMYLLIAVTTSPSLVLVEWDPDSVPAKRLTFQAAFFFVSTWVCFGVGEVLLLVALSVESGHLKNWSKPKPSCLVIRQGLFSAAGVFSLITVFLATGLYLTALQAHRISKDLENTHREIIEASVLYASPPRSPTNRMATVAREGLATVRDESTSLEYLVSLKQLAHIV
ncbi:unnamed protein product [Arabidopsis thaliana]|uniref:At5g49320 n=1 Tax=Arabidopsis thaliana TaxID=3702 RepID=Q9FJ08_ARATH|nr:transmembrane protein, putative (DUF1218) [Arabidopsis thaliana]AAR24682.1 At5g49320 [Arabidopsis thaliana]AAS76225.1 At5g49320 [Arabidopsis thaliana]AED95796.1 transmembrane protein, putative (DUF1218) [Arabidopsis thaliana]BAB10350.1 unnamed protein product [Arabidopsis thaliana]|eukprot:NP_199743.1 transmembrane protein, putative (DUF1218) [Arabidopsis thaliana]